MILEVDNKGAVDLINNYSVDGRTCHMETRKNYLRELKEQGIMSVKWKAGTANSSDLYTKKSVAFDSQWFTDSWNFNWWWCFSFLAAIFGLL